MKTACSLMNNGLPMLKPSWLGRSIEETTDDATSQWRSDRLRLRSWGVTGHGGGISQCGADNPFESVQSGCTMMGETEKSNPNTARAKWNGSCENMIAASLRHAVQGSRKSYR
jgi:hypothetical protein